MNLHLTFLTICRLVLAAAFISGLTVYAAPKAIAQDAAPQGAPQTAPQAAPTIIKSIQVQGNQRVEANTVGSYLLFAKGDPYSESRIDTSV